MSKRIDMTEQRFGKLLVQKYAYTHNGKSMWECKCDCGKIRIVGGTQLRQGKTISCGCVNMERIIMLKYKDGRCKDRLFSVWHNMLNRCYRTNIKQSKYYGLRGIKVCDEWLEYANFKKWAYNNGYDDKAPRGTRTIDRIDVNGNYEPSNCRWVTQREQAQNKRDNYKVTFDGKTTTLAEFSREHEISYNMLIQRIHRGKSDSIQINGQKVQITKGNKNA